ncbi:hypothetical protein ACFE04_031654 [Oxalis oulophora]
MAPSRKKPAVKAHRQYKVGDLVLAKVKGFPAWPAKVSEPQKWGRTPDLKKVFVCFFGTWQIGFCNLADVEPFTEEMKQSLVVKRQGRSADFSVAVKEIVDSYEKLKTHQFSEVSIVEETNTRDFEQSANKSSHVAIKDREEASGATIDSRFKSSSSSTVENDLAVPAEDKPIMSKQPTHKSWIKETSKATIYSSRKNQRKRSKRVKSGKVQSNLMSCSNDDKSVQDLSGNGTRDLCIRRTKRVKKSPDALECDDGPSAAFNLNRSIEDNNSEFFTGDSDTSSFDESTIDSGFKHENSETVLDFQIKAAVIKKKRKPNRKRVISDAAEPLVKLDAYLEEGKHNISQHSESVSRNTDERFSKYDGDEHLPLMKRARVRFFSLEEHNDATLQNEEKPMNGSVNPAEQINSLSNFEDNNVPPSNGTQISDDKQRHWQFPKNEYFGCSADDEAFLPPSKRLHRALQAMSDNIAEDTQTFGGESSLTTKTTTDMSCPDPEVKESTKISGEAEIHNISVESSKSQNDELVNDVFIKLIDEGHHKSCMDADAVQSVIQINSQDLDKQEVSPRSISGSFGNVLPLKDEIKTESAEYSTFSVKTPDKELDTSEHVEIIPNSVSESPEITKVSPEEVNKYVQQYGAEGACSDNTSSFTFQVVNSTQQNVLGGVVSDKVKESPRNISDLHSTERDNSGIHSSPPYPMHDKVDSPAQDPSPNLISCHVSTLENTSFVQKNGFSSPTSHLQRNNFSRALVGEGKTDFSVILEPKYLGKGSNYAEGRAVLSSFETVLGSLTRTKESIARATRMAIDCAKFGASAEAVEILVRNLEIESSLHKRVDLFFLVDSITQRSRALKGDVSVYPSVIQPALPRLLSAAAPPGNIGLENRRQCLKVLKLWLERRILPESVIRQHMRELDSLNGSSFADPYCRRSARTERPMDDPVREIEGMLVDEYGSNSSFCMPGVSIPCMLKHEDEGSDSDGESFEAVTPEHNWQDSEKREVATGIEKHRHILKDVDGELEMEDAAPSCDSETNSTSRENAFHDPFKQQHAPPLPSSPLSPPPPPPPPAPFAIACSHTNGINSKTYVSMNMEGDLQQSLPRHSVVPKLSPTMSPNAVHYRDSDCREPQMKVHSNSSRSFSSDYKEPQMPMHLNSSRFSNNFSRSASVHQTDGRNFHKKPYPPRPPRYPPSNQFPHFRNQRDCNSPSYNHRSHSASNDDRDNYYSQHRRRPPPYGNRDNWRFHESSNSGPWYHDKMRVPYGAGSYDHPPCGDPERIANQRWSYHHQETDHRDSWNFGHPPVGMRAGIRKLDNGATE